MEYVFSLEDYSQQLFSNCGIEDIPVAAFQKYIDQSSGIGCHVNSDELDLTIFNNFTIDFQFLSDVYKSVDEHFSRESVSVDGDNNSPTLNSLGNMTIKRVVTAALFTVRNTTDFNLGLLSARILLRLCSMPGASACGIVNSNVLAAISSLMNKSATHEIQCKPTVEARATSESKM